MLISPKEEDPKKLELESLAISYIDRIIKFDIELGRSKENFFEQNYNLITANVDDFRKRGFRVFIGGGNIFFLKIEQKLTGWTANCLQLRGLAQRKIQIMEDTIQ